MFQRCDFLLFASKETAKLDLPNLAEVVTLGSFKKALTQRMFSLQTKTGSGDHMMNNNVTTHQQFSVFPVQLQLELGFIEKYGDFFRLTELGEKYIWFWCLSARLVWPKE